MTTPLDVYAPRVHATTTYHGFDVVEEYQWLEDASSEATIAWTRAQAARTREYLDGIPWRGSLRSRVDRLLRGAATSYASLASGGSTFFALKEQTPKQRPFLVALDD